MTVNANKVKRIISTWIGTPSITWHTIPWISVYCNAYIEWKMQGKYLNDYILRIKKNK